MQHTTLAQYAICHETVIRHHSSLAICMVAYYIFLLFHNFIQQIVMGLGFYLPIELDIILIYQCKLVVQTGKWILYQSTTTDIDYHTKVLLLILITIPKYNWYWLPKQRPKTEIDYHSNVLKLISLLILITIPSQQHYWYWLPFHPNNSKNYHLPGVRELH